MFVLEQTVVVVIKAEIGLEMPSTASVHLNLTGVDRYLGPLANNKMCKLSRRKVNKRRKGYQQTHCERPAFQGYTPNSLM